MQWLYINFEQIKFVIPSGAALTVDTPAHFPRRPLSPIHNNISLELRSLSNNNDNNTVILRITRGFHTHTWRFCGGKWVTVLLKVYFGASSWYQLLCMWEVWRTQWRSMGANTASTTERTSVSALLWSHIVFIYRFVEKGGEYVSPFHDIPLYANAEKTVCNMIMEVPRWSNAKMEVRYISL